MVKLLLFLIALPSFATVTVTITNGDGTPGGSGCSMPYGIRSGTGNGNACVLILSGSGSYTTSNSFEFFPSARMCQVVTSGGLITGCTDNPSGTLSGGTVELRLWIETDEYTTPAAHCPKTGDIYFCTWHGLAVNGVAIPTTGRIKERLYPPVMSNVRKKTSSDLVSEGCSYSSTSNSNYYDSYPINCPMLTPTYPNVGGYDPPASGGRIVDERYGTTGTMVAFNVIPAPIERTISANGNYAIIRANGDMLVDGIYNLRTGVKIYNFPSGSGFQFLPNAALLAQYNLPEVTISNYGPIGNELIRQHGGPCPSPPCDLINDGVVWTPLHGEAMIQDGGSSTITSKGIKAFYGCTNIPNCGDNQPVANWPHVYLVDVYSNRTIIDMDWSDPRVAAGFNGRTPGSRGIIMTDPDYQGRYIIETGASPPSADAFYFWAKEDGTWGTLGFNSDNSGDRHWQSQADCPVANYKCSLVLHQTPIAVDSNVSFFKSGIEGTIAGQTGNPGYNSATLSTRPKEWGGGGGMDHMPVEHISATIAPWSIIVGSIEPSGPPNQQSAILSISGNPAIAILSAPVSGLVAANQVYIGCLGHLSGSTQQIQGFYTVPTIGTGPDSITLTGLNWTGTGITSSRCYVTKKAPPAASQDRYHIAAGRFGPWGNTTRLMQIGIVAKMVTTNQPDGSGDCQQYFNNQTKPNISPDGSLIVASMNWGQPCGLGSVAWNTPWQLRATKAYDLAPGFSIRVDLTGSGAVRFTARMPTVDSLVCTIGPTPDLLSATTTMPLFGNTAYTTNIFSGVAGTQYYYVCKTVNDDFVAMDTFVPI